ncbi:MAG: TldD/PmbA family protein [Desulfuromonadia bacterium]
MEPDLILSRIMTRLEQGGSGEWELFFSRGKSLTVEVRGGEVDAVRISEPIGCGIRVVEGGSIGFSFTTSFDDRAIDRAIDNARTAARAQTPDPASRLPQPGVYAPVPDLYDHSLPSIPEERKIDVARRLERIALSHDPRIRTVRRAVYADSLVEVSIRNSRGVAGGYRSTSVSCSISLVASEGDDSQSGWDFDTSHHFDRIDPEKIARRGCERATALLGARKIETMRVPVIFDDQTASELLGTLAPSFCGDMIVKGKSRLAEKRGELFFSPHITIVDDGLFPDGAGSAPFDGEGVPSRRILLVEGGRLSAFLLDAFWGGKMGEPSTGSGVRGSFRGTPRPAPRNLFIQPGTTPRRELVAHLDRGVLVTDLVGMHTADPVSGDFSVGISGFLIQGGEIAFPIREMVLTGNLFDLFARVIGVGDDLRMFGPVGSPSLLVDGMDLSGS